MSQTYINSLKSQNASLQAEVERYATGIDKLSQQLAAALNRLKAHDPEFVASIVGEDPGENVPVVVIDGESAGAE
ncbi:hypothetical protein [Mycoplana rhizolycopersici]|uniref:Uncharacterized protein n=1 Tax=Mycoplana rhizolycopersici TaxID=2746702 RepID=A0ABX2QBW7_9HYPH|nr:hypothetical protein [Rhizobium rhizolycopersici]NVP54454.1 hypothetical protein [Rhizobium rhizolycopersici]